MGEKNKRREKRGDIEGREERCGREREKKRKGEREENSERENERGETRDEKEGREERGRLGQWSQYLHGGHSPCDLPSSPKHPISSLASA